MTPNSVKPLCFIINNSSEYTTESKGDKHMTLIPIDESRGKLREYEKYEEKSKTLLNKQLITQMIMMKKV